MIFQLFFLQKLSSAVLRRKMLRVPSRRRAAVPDDEVLA